jgi:hypothetical protein
VHLIGLQPQMALDACHPGSRETLFKASGTKTESPIALIRVEKNLYGQPRCS